MTINEAITNADNLKPNQYSQTQKIKWLATLDGIIFKEVYLTHNIKDENGDIIIPEYHEYTENTDLETELLVPSPYDDDIYVNYLEAQVDKNNGEYQRYNQNIMFYNEAYLRFQNWFNQNNEPIMRQHIFSF